MNDEKFAQWCVVEIMGFQKLAGLVTEEERFGTKMLRIDVPESGGTPAYTKYFGTGAIYAVTPVSKEVVDNVLEHTASRPVQIYDPIFLGDGNNE